MAQQTIQIADKPTLDEIKNIIGTAENTGTNTLFGAVKQSSPHKYANNTSGSINGRGTQYATTITGSGVITFFVGESENNSTSGVGRLTINVDGSGNKDFEVYGFAQNSITLFFSESIYFYGSSYAYGSYFAQFD